MTRTTALTPLDNTKAVRFANFNRPGTQIWEATSKDGRWTYVRLEIPRTPWATFDNATDQELLGWAGTLRDARVETAQIDAGTRSPRYKPTVTAAP